MDANDLQIQLCSFSYHTEPFRQTYKNGLDTYIFRLQIEGRCEILIDQAMVQVLPNDLVMFEPGEIYDLAIGNEQGLQQPSGDYYIMCTGQIVDAWWRAAPRPKKTKIALDGRIQGLWHQLIMEKRRLDSGDPGLLALLMQSLCMLLDRAIAEAPSFQSSSSYLAYRMKFYIEEHANRPLKLEDVARHLGVSVSRAVHLFKAHFGVSIMQYAQKIRLTMALELMMLSQMTLEQIADEAGFGSYSYFHRVFQAHYAMSPGKYRQTRARE